MITSIILTLVTIVPVVLCISFFTVLERKVIAAIQRIRGPNVVGVWGALQAFADGLKLILSEIIIPLKSYRFFFSLAPFWTFVLSLVNWAFIPFNYVDVLINTPYSLLYVFILSSFGVYGVILAGWSSRSRYPFLGSLRAAAQMISYEVSLSLVFCIIALTTGSLNFIDIVSFQEESMWLILPLFPISVIFFITMLAETNRPPFYLP